MGWEDRTWNREGASFGGGQNRATTLFVAMGVLLAAHIVVRSLDQVAMDGAVGSVGKWLTTHGALSREGVFSGKIWQVLTYQFLHANLLHLIFNLVGLYFLGRLALGLWGAKRFLLTIAICGALGGFIDRLMPWQAAQQTVVGVSGAVSAILGLLLITVPNLPVALPVLRPIKMKWLVLALVGIDLLRGVGADTQIAVGTHLWCFAVGCGWAYYGPRRIEPWFKGRAQRKEQAVKAAARQREAHDAQELDRILEKINAEGMAALTDKERDFLKRRAEAQKQRR